MNSLKKLSKLDNTDIETIASVLKGVKIGQGYRSYQHH